MKKITFIIFLSVFNLVYSQENKKILFKNNSNKEISKQEFEKLSNHNTYTDISENDSLIIKKIIYKEKTVKLDSVKLDQIQKFLSHITGSKYQTDRNTIIHLFDNDNSILKESIDNKNYWKWIRRNKDKFQAFLIGTKNSGVEKNLKKNILLDHYDLLKSLFFKDSKFEVNHLFIKSNGNITIYHGGKDIIAVLDSSV